MDDLDTLLSGADQQPTQDQQTTAPSAPQDLDSILQKAEPTPPAQDLDTLLQKAEGGQLHSYQGTGFKQGDSAHLDARNPDVYQKFLQGFAKQESDNRYGLIGPPSSQGRALGKYQITQAELNQLHAKIGITNNPQEFLNSPDQQEKAMASLLSDKINRYGGSIEDIILDHYGGPGAVKSYHNYLAGNQSGLVRATRTT